MNTIKNAASTTDYCEVVEFGLLGLTVFCYFYSIAQMSFTAIV